MFDKNILDYIDRHTSDETELMHLLNRKTHLEQMYPRMLSGKVQGKFLKMISLMIRPERILEIGTFTGYSAICLADGLTPNGKLHTIEADPEIAEFAAAWIEKAGLQEKVIQHSGEALQVIPQLTDEFDLVFIDADKENYLNYYKQVLPIVKPGGFILADNTLWDGKVTDPAELSDKETRGIVEFNDFVQNDPQVENVLLSVRDGVLLIRKRNNRENLNT
ncbi:MAG: class I SAM-dependent methyltransferase [Bacteroidales bacterium]|nr:class I SAM-dependent methyltransferase [Bacteroidales bacterium]